MSRIRVRRQTLADESEKGLVGRLESVVEALRNRGDRIVAIMPSPMPMREIEWKATIFYEHDEE